MYSKVKTGLLTAIAALVLTSCCHDIDLDGYREDEGENLLTLNSIINPDSTIRVAATKTYFFSDVHNDRSYVGGLQIEMFVNGVSKGFMTYNKDSKMYDSEIYPQEGDEIRLSTNYQGATVSCCDKVPKKM